MWVVVMAAWKGRNGQPMMGMYVTSHLWYLYTHIHRHDFNSALGQGKTFANWDDIKHHWDAYAQQAIGGEEHDDSDEDARPMLCRKKGQKRPQTVLPTMEDGTPMIPIILDMQALERKDVMRTFVTWCQVRVYSGKGSGQVRTETDEGQGQRAGQEISLAGVGDRLDSTTKDNKR